MPHTILTTTATTSTRIASANNVLGIREYDLVKTVGKGICIALRKKSLNDELVLYSISSAMGRHAHDDDGMAKVRRYNADGTIATTSESTGNNLRNREKYTIVGIKSYVNPVLAMKDFINQNTDIAFDPIVVPNLNVANGFVDNNINRPANDVTATGDANMAAMFTEMIGLLRDMNDKLDNI